MILAKRCELSLYLTTKQCPIANGCASHLSIMGNASCGILLDVVERGEAFTEPTVDDVTEAEVFLSFCFFMDVGAGIGGGAITSSEFLSADRYSSPPFRLDRRLARFAGGASGDGIVVVVVTAAAAAKLEDESRDRRFILTSYYNYHNGKCSPYASSISETFKRIM